MKRKRSKELERERRVKNPENPFLELQMTATAYPSEAKQRQENVLSKVLAFSDLSRQRPDDDDVEFHKDVVDLLRYLETIDRTSTDSLFLSPVDVTNILLHWALKSLLYTSSSSHQNSDTSKSKTISLYWKALRSCLQVLLSLKDDSSSELSSCLSQSALNKLVPYAARESLDEKVGNDAMACYTLLVDQLHRLTMDSACHSLLPFVDERLSQSGLIDEGRLVLPSKDHVCMLESTLHLLQMPYKAMRTQKRHSNFLPTRKYCRCCRGGDL